MTNKRKEVTLRYKVNEDPEIKELTIYEDDTPQSVVERSGRKGNFFVVDSLGNPFGKSDNLFGYATMRGAPPVTIMHGSGLRTMKTRNPTEKKDNRIRVEIRFGGENAVFERTTRLTYQQLLDQNREFFHLANTWQIAVVRAEEDRIIVERVEGTNPFWFSEKLCPPIQLTEDRIYQAARAVPPGKWGKPVTY
jgi:hypothetical protein